MVFLSLRLLAGLKSEGMLGKVVLSPGITSCYPIKHSLGINGFSLSNKPACSLNSKLIAPDFVMV